ncbi:hypothetical protein SAMD00019534_071210 [Acytostelium subglobosum LB1]|uniref:hypothetical protein n=1 Tax=Acytostelium subglobosum LB1 TaxID=1410327 RepID=UPI000644AC69|nr:hypothetical protein SAMD00019534_071210 [Acytostelium subglobosum LB1]GAM23946.1 hypothetical protein SAMD00019534_071210 [Acytostelium subglobosum LB1]|eukprot:XP_012752982.1 hypothetical protein SAMD00019534_071210 [Acytostelium subglobosum LB1]
MIDIKNYPRSLRSLSLIGQTLPLPALPDSLTKLNFVELANVPVQQLVGNAMLSSSLTSLSLRDNFNQEIPPLVLPMNLKTLVMGDNFNESLPTDDLGSLTSISFGILYNRPLADIPPSVTSLSLSSLQQQDNGDSCLIDLLCLGLSCKRLWEIMIVELSQSNQTGLACFLDQSSALRSQIHPTLNTANDCLNTIYPAKPERSPQRLSAPITAFNHRDGLWLGTKFNQQIVLGSLPSILMSLEFGRQFNQPFKPGSLPDSITSLMFGKDYNQPLTGSVLPSSLLSLVFGDYFNQVIKTDTLPLSLTSLTFGSSFNQPIDDALPPRLSTLKLGERFDQELTRHDSIVTLQISIQGYRRIDTKSYPRSLRSLSLVGLTLPMPAVPDTITELNFIGILHVPIKQMVGKALVHSSVTSLTFGYIFNQKIPPKVLPINLKTLVIGDNFNRPLPMNALRSLTSISFGRLYALPLTDMPPIDLTLHHQ